MPGKVVLMKKGGKAINPFSPLYGVYNVHELSLFLVENRQVFIPLKFRILPPVVDIANLTFKNSVK